MVIVADEDFEKANVTASHTIEIQDFVDASTIAPAFFERPYFLLPDRRGQKGLRSPPRSAGGKESRGGGAGRSSHPAAPLLRTAEGDLLVLELLRFAHELRPAREVLAEGKGDAGSKPSARERALAEQLIERMVVDWIPRYKDTYRDDLLAAIPEQGEDRRARAPARADDASRLGNDSREPSEKSVATAKKKRARRAA